MSSQKQGIQFPVEFPLKAMGLNTPDLPCIVHTIVEKHVSPEEVTYTEQLSRSGKYLSITATFIARDRQQLDAVYEDLNSHELILMTL